MAEIEIERRPRRSGWTWFALLLVLAAVAVGAWLVMDGGADAGAAAPAAETTSEQPASEYDVMEPLSEPTEPAGPVEDPATGLVEDPDEPVSSGPGDGGA